MAREKHNLNLIQRSLMFFGREIGGIEEELIYNSCRKEDGRYIIPIEVPHPLVGYFSSYHLHVMPISKRSFLISGTKFNSTFDEYSGVKALLESKYGTPEEGLLAEKEHVSCTFQDGKKKVGLVFTHILGKPQLYISAWRVDLLEKNLLKELAEYHEMKLERREKQEKEKLDAL